MKLDRVIAVRNDKTIYRDGDKCIKVFGSSYSKADVLNEALRDRVDKYLKEYGTDAKIRVGYGLTECTGASCLTPKHYFKEGGIGIPFPDKAYESHISVNSPQLIFNNPLLLSYHSIPNSSISYNFSSIVK